MAMTGKVIIMVFAIFITSSFILTPFAGCDDFKYESRGRRDPFVPLIGADKPAIARLEDITSAEDVRLEGIAIGAGGKRIAVINGEMLKEGDKAGDIELKKIDKKMVILAIGGKDYNIKLPEEGGAKSE